MSDPLAITPAARRGDRLRVVLVSGLSGAGKTAAIKVLEDLGYEAINNLPLALLPNLFNADSGVRPRHGAIAADIDVRTHDFTAERLLARLAELEERPDLAVELLFLDCDDEVLTQRFTETRRRHPLAEERPLLDGVRRERSLLAPLHARADEVIDTTHLSPPELRQLLGALFRLADSPRLAVMVTSFAYRNGVPREADLVFDVRFLRNPHYQAVLRPLDGRDPTVARFIAADPAYPPFFARIADLVLSLLPYYEREGKTYLTIAVGCTGGRHRSVFVAEQLAQALRAQQPEVFLRHRGLIEADAALPPVAEDRT